MVVRVLDPAPGDYPVEVVDESGSIVTSIQAFLGLLTLRAYSPNTVRAYAHDLAKLHTFLDERGLTVNDFRPRTAVAFVQWLRTRPVAG